MSYPSSELVFDQITSTGQHLFPIWFGSYKELSTPDLHGKKLTLLSLASINKFVSNLPWELQRVAHPNLQGKKLVCLHIIQF